mmetsp:Transcript_6442/g.15561  ORF Transcript_6442/g.15561 Transcript_6442/m.15561 type:complete len:132 (+) Transcript_6442:908-1303(+)
MNGNVTSVCRPADRQTDIGTNTSLSQTHTHTHTADREAARSDQKKGWLDESVSQSTAAPHESHTHTQIRGTARTQRERERERDHHQSVSQDDDHMKESTDTHSLTHSQYDHARDRQQREPKIEGTDGRQKR